jgi:hypothetical protein
MKFFKKLCLLILPFLLLTICYIYTDPYKILRKYDVYLSDVVMLSRGDVSTRVYLANRKKYNYNSFIFGSSRASSHTSKEWKKYLDKNAIPYSFGAWEESIYAIYKKLALIDSLKDTICNTFIVMDVDKTFLKSNYWRIEGDHYLISGKTKLDYYFTAYQNYLLSPELILSSLDYKIFGKYRPYMKGFVNMNKEDLDPISNDWFPNSDAQKLDSLKYTSDLFYERNKNEHYSKKLICAYEESILFKIAGIFHKHNTKYKIVISPLYDQIKINPDDLHMLQTIFGSENIYDYSGINEITNNKYDYALDVSHYRKVVGNMIFPKIYTNTIK